MNVLSLFDGMSCGRIALDRANIQVDKYYASEIDKYAIQVSEDNYSDIVRLGDVTNWRDWSIDWTSIDLLIAGSPCQGFSFAGKQLAFDDPRSALFFVFVDIKKHISEARLRAGKTPLKFLLENVRMKKEFLDVISEYVGVEPVFINSQLVSAQSRPRYYWANWDFARPEDKGIYLKDIVEDGVFLHLGNENIKFHRVEKSKSDGLEYVGFVESKKSGKRINDGKNLSRNIRQGNRVYSVKGKASALAANLGNLGGPTGYYDFSEILKEKIISNHIDIDCNFGDKSNALLPNCHQSRWIADDELLYRKLTPIECERLQTVPDNYTKSVSNTQRYRMLGNGWTVDVIAHIFDAMNFNKSLKTPKD